MTSQGYARIEDIPEGRGVTPALDDLEAGYDESLLPRIREENGLRYPNAPEGKWSSGLCNCCGHLPTCCMVFWCPCIPLGQIAQKSRLIKNGFYTVIGLFLLECVLYPINPGTLHMFKRRTGEMIDCGPAVIVISVVQIIRFCCCIALMCIAVLARRRVAKLYRIPNNIVGNCCTVCWCSCCSIIQVARHLFNWNPGMGVACDWSREPMSHWPDVPIAPNEMAGREEL